MSLDLQPKADARRGSVSRAASPRFAFTLIEVLLALAICAIILAAINAVFATAVHLRDKTSNAVDEDLPLERALDVIDRDLKGAVGPGGILAGDFKCGVPSAGSAMGLSASQGGGLDFFCSTGEINDNAPWGDIQEVFYQLKAPTDGNQASGQDLVRCINRNVLGTSTPTPDIQVLMGNVQSLEFECYDGVDWRPTWDTSETDTNLPTAVRITFQLAAKAGDNIASRNPIEMIVPLVIQTRTNAAQIPLTTGGGTP